MPPKEGKLSLLLNGGVDNRSLPELVAPLVKQGESPKLVASTNTRLSVKPGTCMRAPKFTRIKQFAAGTKRWGLIPSRIARNAISQAGPANGTFYVSGDGSGGLAGGMGEGSDPYVYQSAYVPARITRAGALDTVPVVAPIAVGHNPTSGQVWRAYPMAYAPNGTGGPTYYQANVAVWTLDGKQLAASRAAIGIGPGAIRWVGITCHGASGDLLWYAAPHGICYRPLSVFERTISVGPETVVVVPGIATTGIDVVSNGSTHVYLTHQQSGSTSGATVRRVDITNGTTTHSVTLAGALAGGGKCSVQYGTLNGATRVAVAFSRVTGAKTTIALYDSTLSVVGAPFERNGYGDVSCGFFDFGSSHAVLALVSLTAGDFSSNPAAFISGSFIGTRTYLSLVDSWGTGVIEGSFPWLVQQAHCVQWVLGSNQFPIFFLGRSYGDVNNAFGESNYVDDPGVVAYVYISNTPQPVARVGVVRGNLSPAYVATQECLSSRSAFATGNQITLTYRKLPASFSSPVISTGRFVVLDLSANQPATAHDKDGCALTAAALPVQFDGERFTEIGGPFHAPKIGYIDNSLLGIPQPLPNGVYSFVAYYEWTDNAGAVHRSRPSNVITKTVLSPLNSFNIFGTTPDGMTAREVNQTFLLLYATETNGTSFHLYDRTTVTNQANVALFVSHGEVDGGSPQIYSTGSSGEEILPQPAPPLRDIVTIGPRAWGIDAEVPTRIVYSKLRIAGVGYEFFPAGEVNLPSDAGEAFAVREWQGLTIILCERGVYEVSGDGPNNAGGGDFAPPIKRSDIGCSNTASAVSFPGGIIWQSGTRFAMLGPGGIDFVPAFDCTYDVTHAMLLRRYEEILFFSSTVAEVRVYNYSVGRWTTWDSQTLEAPVTCAALLPYNEDQAFLYSESTGFMYRLDADSVSPCANMTWEIDWTLLGGDFQDHVILRDVIFNGTILSAHSLTIEVYLDYDESAPSTTRTWVDATVGDTPGLAAIAVGGRYTVRLEPEKQNARAIKIRVYDTVAPATEDRRGVQPRSLTVLFAIDGILYEEVFVEGSFK